MTANPNLTRSRRGAWIINTSKHLLGYDQTHPGLSALDNLSFAGKCGSLLIKLSADETEQLSDNKVKAHARLCAISPRELSVYLDTLRTVGCLDWDASGSTYEVLAFTRRRVLTTTSQILESSVSSNVESALLDFLEFCLHRPRLQSESREFLSKLLPDDEVEQLLGLIQSFGLLGIADIRGQVERLFFNEYQFGDRAVKIGKALLSLSNDQRQQLNALLAEVTSHPGIPLDSLSVPKETTRLAVALGLVEVSEVSSSIGTARFVTMPRLSPPSVDRETGHLEDDVFHHAKMLLSSLRFGELRSTPSRGRIIDPPVLVRALLNSDRVGPCTAIGEDYVILEGEGVIRTIPSRHKANQFFMELRRREPAEMVLGLLQSGSSHAIDAKSLPASLQLPLGYSGPEVARPAAVSKVVQNDPEILRRFLEELRT